MKKFIIDRSIQDWLRSLGYEVAGASPERIVQWFYREARQWEMTPDELEQFIKQTHRAYKPPSQGLPAWTRLTSV